MVEWINQTGTLGIIFTGLQSNVGGSLFFTLLIILMLFVTIMLMMRIPIEFQAIIMLPFLFVLMAYTQEFLAFGGIALILLAVVFAKAIAKS